jgi:hypothetical protein
MSESAQWPGLPGDDATRVDHRTSRGLAGTPRVFFVPNLVVLGRGPIAGVVPVEALVVFPKCPLKIEKGVYPVSVSCLVHPELKLG